AAHYESRYGLRIVQGTVQPDVATDRSGKAVLGWSAVAVWKRAGRSHLSFSARVATGAFAARFARHLLRIAVRASHARRGSDVGANKSGSHGARPALSQCGERWPHHARRDGRGSVRD